MGAALVGSIASSNTVGLLQNWHYGSRAEKLSKLAYELDFQGLRLDVLGTIREEIRDQVFVIMSGLDNLMVVATLMLSIGFGFVVEGTFPPQKAEELGNWKCETLGIDVDPLCVYSFLCALSLCFPFWCLIFTIRMRYEVELIIHGHMSELRRQLANVLKKRKMIDPDTEVHDQAGGADPQREISKPLAPVGRVSFKTAVVAKILPSWVVDNMRRKFRRCPGRVRAVREPVESAADKFAQNLGPFSIPDEPSSIEQAQIIQWAQKDLLYRMKYYHFYLVLAHLFLWLGMLSAIFTCAILLGVYMKENFPNTPMMWQAYTYPVAVSGFMGVLYAGWIWLQGHTPATLTNCSAAACWPQSCNPSLQRADASVDSFTQPLLGRGQTAETEPVERRRATRRTSSIEASPFRGASSPNLSRHMSANRLRGGSLGNIEEEGPVVYELRVRDASAGHDAFRRVCFNQPPSQMSMADIEVKICGKFDARNAAANEPNSPLGGVPGHVMGFARQFSGATTAPLGRELSEEETRRTVDYLIRLSDRLEICDDDDVAELRNGDRLEVTFARRRRRSLAPHSAPFSPRSPLAGV
eukprot:TRINITY_DN110938_c0_g1_i1.p1 TRINITY_DN110938_c0_g1~~TRINITY_DN110938_c0_g1_i1.p1  ORF type:complete len:582 (-),score=67.03 TRINITY_DN110938_c0_g1_i1:148-1893(-)